MQTTFCEWNDHVQLDVASPDLMPLLDATGAPALRAPMVKGAMGFCDGYFF